MARRPRGFTLIELMVGLVLVAILALLATPTFSTMRGNARIRNTADSIAHGIRLAQVEALRRNRAVEFQITPATGWRIFDPDPAVGGQVQAETFDVTNVVVAVNPPGATMLTWSGIGAYVDPNPSDASAPVTFINVSSPTTPDQKDLRIVVGPALGQGVRVCDPDFTVVAQPVFGCP